MSSCNKKFAQYLVAVTVCAILLCQNEAFAIINESLKAEIKVEITRILNTQDAMTILRVVSSDTNVAERNFIITMNFLSQADGNLGDDPALVEKLDQARTNLFKSIIEIERAQRAELHAIEALQKSKIRQKSLTESSYEPWMDDGNDDGHFASDDGPLNYDTYKEKLSLRSKLFIKKINGISAKISLWCSHLFDPTGG